MRYLLVVFLLISIFSSPIEATSYVKVADEVLVDQSELAITGRVIHRQTGILNSPWTFYTVAVERVMKGESGEATVVVKVLGGETKEGRFLKIYGAPQFSLGNEVLLLLSRDKAGDYRIKHLMQGAFHGVEASGYRLALRDFSESKEFGTPRPESMRDFDAFANWIEARASGEVLAADYRISPTEPLRFSQEFYVLFDEDGLNFRWFQFDDGSDVNWRAHENGQDGLSGGGYSQFNSATKIWNLDGNSNIDYDYRGITSGNIGSGASNCTAGGCGFERFDNTNAILFNDPHGTITEGPFDCSSGGVLAIGGPWADSGNTRSWDGNDYLVIIGADIVTNAGAGCFFTDGCSAAEVFAHELGHTLGFDHSQDGTALMWPFAHQDGRCATLSQDDRNGIAFLYAEDTAPEVDPPAAPTNLAANTVSPSEIMLIWEDQSNDEQKFRIERMEEGGTFEDIASVGANKETFTDTELDSDTTYSYRVRAKNQGGFSAYSNTSSATTGGLTPTSPSGLTAMAQNDTQVNLVWTDEATTETGFTVEQKMVGLWDANGFNYGPGPWSESLTVGPDVTEVVISGLTAEGTYEFRVRADGSAGNSDPTTPAVVTTREQGTLTACVDSGTTLCLLENRFRVEVGWRVITSGNLGQGQVIPNSNKTGFFWFFNQENVELVVKMLDGTSVNGKHWVFYGALSTVDYWIRVTDTTTANTKTYFNPDGELCGLGDTGAFDTEQLLHDLPFLEAVEIPLNSPQSSSNDFGSGVCTPNDTTLCLQNNRFSVTVLFQVGTGPITSGHAIPITGNEKSGYFWFFNNENIELVVKMLDGSTVNGYWWIFYGALSDVEYQVRVTDLQTGLARIYSNEQGNICGVGDTQGLLDSP